LWKDGPLGEGLSFGKRTRGISHGLGTPLKAVSPLCSSVNSNSSIVVAAVRAQWSIINGILGGKVVEVMVDSGSSVSLVRQSVIMPNHKVAYPPKGLQLMQQLGSPSQF